MSAATTAITVGPAEHGVDASDRGHYVGLVTRAIAFVLDAAAINLVAIVVALAVALALSLLHLPQHVRTVIAAVGGFVYIVWSIAYFVGFWSTTGQTPGSRAMQIRVVPVVGDAIRPRRALVRLIGVVVGALALGAGYVPILFDSRRRGLQDRLARTLVVDAPEDVRR